MKYSGMEDAAINSIGSRFLYLVEKDPNRKWCTYFSGDQNIQNVSYGELCERALKFAATYGVSDPARKRVAICLYQSIDLHAAFLGAILSGHIPAMMPPFSPKTEAAKFHKTVHHFLESAKPDILVIDNGMVDQLIGIGIKFNPTLNIIEPSSLARDSFMPGPQRSGDEIAFIQHSSGTTGLQKGVALSHASVLRHQESYCRAIDLQVGRDSIVSWLPLYHDMGLIACFILPLVAGLTLIEIPTLAWASKPSLLFEAITKYRPTLCWLPNFSYTFLAQSLKRNPALLGWDLSSIRMWVNCSEPVTDGGHATFLEAFGGIGCNPNSLAASYAMAENVFAVSQSDPLINNVIKVSKGGVRRNEISIPIDANDVRTLVGCGSPLYGVNVKIIDSETGADSKHDIGEIAIKSNFMFTGYWNNPEATRAAFNSDGYYKTGDIGFLLDGQIFVTGRLKDVIIIQGKNVHAGDVEACLSGVEGVIPGRVVAFGMVDEDMGSERLVILAETNSDDAAYRRQLTSIIRAKISVDLNLAVSIIRLLPPKWLIKSTSGKMARKENREKLMALSEGNYV